MRDRSEIWQSVLADAGIRCSVRTARDFDTVTRRVKNEGDAFFTKALPIFAKEFERSLEEGVLVSRYFKGFGRKTSTVNVTPPIGNAYKVEVPGGIPKFLSGFLEIIFDSHWDVTSAEFAFANKIARESSLSDCNLFPPSIRIPKDAEEEERMAEAIHCIRQLTLLFSKEWAMPDQDLIDMACEGYVTTDKELDAPFMTGELIGFYSRVNSRTSRGFSI